MDLAGDVYQEGALMRDVALYEGEEASKGRTMQADSARMEGKQAQTGSYFGAAGTILGGIGKFAGSGAKSSFSTYKPNQKPGNYRYG